MLLGSMTLSAGPTTGLIKYKLQWSYLLLYRVQEAVVAIRIFDDEQSFAVPDPWRILLKLQISRELSERGRWLHSI